ncbi:hypothetical protein BBBOND_0312500 [Babesia bigemina]|uniref:6-Cys domain-containing protein n=1 Tax=Babesia bigemina TaxID=5866 RepID=A0A061DBM9_BABBI|nr:hypothetical protein BBBOND_0312500 [Babesia bigemina]CDR97347.1 hypothetical protein BBBOND_0312500 [Babesia bigemina]|eukprot:XP_012769533.1 hypothetical protein BBBOND_0312500 [Babesia bigemina]
MAKLGVTVLSAFCAITLHSIIRIEANVCDFSNPDAFADGFFVQCSVDTSVYPDSTAICPRQYKGIEYTWHPRPREMPSDKIYGYVKQSGKLASRKIRNMVRSEFKYFAGRYEATPSGIAMKFKYPEVPILAMTESRFIFICGPKTLVVSDDIEREIYHLSDITDDTHPNSSRPLHRRVGRNLKDIGVLFLNRGRTSGWFYGCGMLDSPLFPRDNNVSLDLRTDVMSCVVDPMTTRTIGFTCDGIVEPPGCNGLLSWYTEPAIPRISTDVRVWMTGRIFNDLALPEYDEMCICKHSDTYEVKSIIHFRSQNVYTCDIAGLLDRHRRRPISGPWCSVVLHPGSTLTIKFPTFIIDKDSETSDLIMMGINSNDLGFGPRDLEILRQLKSIDDFNSYEEVPYNQALAGNALELDVSEVEGGEVKLKYRKGRPLALRNGANRFEFHWTMVNAKHGRIHRTVATVSLALAFTHRYDDLGFDVVKQKDVDLYSVFNPEKKKKYTSVRRKGNGIGDVYEYRVPIDVASEPAVIYCKSDRMLPKNCGYESYDLLNNRVVGMGMGSTRVRESHLPGFRKLHFDSVHQIRVSKACYCVDQRGYEKYRIAFESHYPRDFVFEIFSQGVPKSRIPYVLLPWKDAEASSDGVTLSEWLRVNDVVEASVTMQVGDTVSLDCRKRQSSPLQCSPPPSEAHSDSTATWMPRQPEQFHYLVSQTGRAFDVLKRKREDSLVITPGGLKIGLEHDPTISPCRKLILQADASAIVISKDPLNYETYPMAFFCGIAPEGSELSVNSDTPSLPNMKVVGPANLEMWHMVRVNFETTDPYMQGCGVTYESTELFKPETPTLYDDNGQEIGCRIDINAAEEAAFYCPPPYSLYPPGCFFEVDMDGEVEEVDSISDYFTATTSNHFVILKFRSGFVRPGETMLQTPPLECRCITNKGVILSTIQIVNYHTNLSKYRPG